MKIGYMRVSTEDQTHDLQEDSLKRFGCDEIYSDVISGKTTNREGLNNALSRLDKNDTLVVWKLDRLGRNASYLFDLVESLNGRGVSFHSITENFDTSTPIGKMMFQMMGVFAEFERGRIQERVIAGVRAAQDRGVWCGREPMDTDIRDNIIQLRGEGMSYKKVANETGLSKTTVYNVIKGRYKNG